MITRADIVERVAEWGLTEEVVEKDYVLGWLLWGIGTDPVLSQQWVFKGGTCLKKCYIETYRFSEDLDFTVLPGGPFEPSVIEPLLLRTLERVHDASGIQFAAKPPALRLRPEGLSTEGRVYYVGPRQTPVPARVKLDISANEAVVRPPVLREIGHPYPDPLPGPGRVRCYSFEELFAEKVRAMAQRGRPRDLYDIVNLFRRNDLRLYPEQIHAALVEKCAVKSIAVPTAADFVDSPSAGRTGLGLGTHARAPTACATTTDAVLGGAADAVRLARRHHRVRRTSTDAVRRRRERELVPAGHRGNLAHWRSARGGAVRRDQPPPRRAWLPGRRTPHRALRFAPIACWKAAAARRAGRRRRTPHIRR